MSDWYKMDPVAWNDGTDDLSLEQEAAYLRICHAIYIAERPVRDNGFVIAGLLRCNERKAKRLLAELVEAGKLTIEDGLILNRRALDEVSNRNQIRIERKSAGSRGGIETAKARAKPLETHAVPSANAPAVAATPVVAEEIRGEEKKKEPTAQHTISPRAAAAPDHLDKMLDRLLEANGVSGFREERAPGLAVLAPIIGLIEAGFDLDRDILPAIRAKPNPSARRWNYFEPQIREHAAVRSKAAATPKPIAASEDWTARLGVYRASGTWSHAWGPKPGEAGCRAPADLLRQVAA